MRGYIYIKYIATFILLDDDSDDNSDNNNNNNNSNYDVDNR